MPRAHTSRILAVLGSAFLGLFLPSCGSRTTLIARGDGGAYQSGVEGGHNRGEDGTCPSPASRCGSGEHAQCQRLDSDPANCGSCGHSCTPGIDCSDGICQQTPCTGPVAFHEIGRFPGRLSGTKDPSRAYLGADVNRDGRLDLLEYDYGDDSTAIVIWLGQGDGKFVASNSYPTVGNAGTPALPGYAAVADFNEDGLADLVVTRGSGASVEVRPGLPGGGFGGRAGIPLDRLQIADLDRDGHLDVVSAPLVSPGDIRQFTVLLGRGDGALTKVAIYGNHDVAVGSVAVLDWDGDGIPDVLTGYITLHIMPGNGDGTFASDQNCGVGLGAFADFNQDGRLDLAWMDPRINRAMTIFGLGACKFSPRTDYPLSFEPAALGVGDISGDGLLDLLVSSHGNRTALFLGKGDGTFATGPDLDVDTSGYPMFIADVTDDGRADIVITQYDGIVVYSNTCAR